MKRLLSLLILLVCLQVANANDQVRNLQLALKGEGFYFGEVDGKPGAELNAALRRYQIRNGLDVTGEANDETLQSLGLAAETKKPGTPPAPAATPRPQAPPVPQTTAPAQRPPVHLRREDNVEENDRQFMERETGRAPRDPSVLRPPAPLDEDPIASEPSSEFSGIFAGTPYQKAPRVVQEQTIRRAQAILASRGYYNDPIDGDPGPATEEAVLAFQRGARLPLTGRLDLNTLAQLRLLPGRGDGNPKVRPFQQAPRSSSRQEVYRGIWVE